jgi:septum formation protein
VRELVLASKSPRRRQLLKLTGHPFVCIPSNVDEGVVNGEPPDRYVTILSELKAKDVGDRRENGIIIGSDTIVVFDGKIFEKPVSPEEAVEMIMILQGQTHTVYTGFALYDAKTHNLFSGYEKTHVTMRGISLDLARKYVETEEPLDKAGAYGIQGYGAVLISSIQGCYFTVMGLPLRRLMEALYTFSDGEFEYFVSIRNQPDKSTAELDA